MIIMMKKLKAKLKAKLRNWLFSDYKWITRAEVKRLLHAAKWENRDSHKIIRVLNSIEEQLGYDHN